MQSPIIVLGKSGEEFAKLNGIDLQSNVNRQPAGLNFYKKRFKSGKLPVALFKHGKYSFEIPNLIRVTGIENTDFLERGIDDISASWGFTNESEKINNDEAKNRLLQFMRHLLSLGWRQVHSYSHPRLSGEESWQYKLNNYHGYQSDITVTPTLETWLKLNTTRTTWRFYADGVFIEVGFMRNSRIPADDPMGEYLLVFSAYTREERARKQFRGEQREHWQELWIPEIQRLKSIRYTTEAELEALGFTINTEYQDPKIHPADPVEP
ncbi:hypothetical protein ACMXYX_00560 [Neptuniibacter sp. QD72_48]|uniref:hypothetical protein n=1 Tax=unclassified Neptuniibacter TaxID=2630693 RepID=UPI0039F5120E